MSIDPKRWRWTIPWLFLAPALIFFFTWFKFVPIIKGLIMSFYEVKFVGGPMNGWGWPISSLPCPTAPWARRRRTH
ncbi:hypothetical protein QW131_32355 [Roseibium salinum]|nr:hypothetical protein [Roseibium salinum]